jgi:hypothetical protein
VSKVLAFWNDLIKMLAVQIDVPRIEEDTAETHAKKKCTDYNLGTITSGLPTMLVSYSHMDPVTGQEYGRNCGTIVPR